MAVLLPVKNISSAPLFVSISACGHCKCRLAIVMLVSSIKSKVSFRRSSPFASRITFRTWASDRSEKSNSFSSSTRLVNSRFRCNHSSVNVTAVNGLLISCQSSCEEIASVINGDYLHNCEKEVKQSWQSPTLAKLPKPCYNSVCSKDSVSQ